MADAQILATQVEPAPLEYVIPGGQEIILKALFASFDGTGAAGDFLPCVRILSDAGKVVGEYVTDSAVTAGNSADVSFAPFLRNAQASGATAQSYAIFNGFGTTGTVQHWTGVTTNDAATFSVDGGDDTLAVISTAGFYIVVLEASVAVLTSPYTIPNNHACNCVETTGGSDVTKLVLVIRNQTAGTLPASGSEYYASVAIWPYFATSPPWKMRVNLTNADANVSVAGRLRFIKFA